MKKIALFITATILVSTAHAQEYYSLKAAIDYSLNNHESNLIYKNELRKVAVQTKEALASYLPQVNGTVSFDDNLKRQVTVLPGVFLGQTKDILVQFGNKYNTNALIQLDQTIFDKALIYGLKAGVPSKKLAELNIAKNNEELAYNTATAYSQVLILKEQQKLILENGKQYEELYRIIKFRFDKGVAKKVDLDKVTVQLNNIKLQKKQVLTNIEVSYNSLKNAMGLPQNSVLQIVDTLEYMQYQQLSPNTLDVKDMIDYQLQTQNIALQEIDVKRKQAAYLPTVEAYARYGQQAFSNELGKSFTNWQTYSTIGLKLNVPIFSGRRKDAQLQLSRLELENQKSNLALNTLQLQMQFQNANRQLQENISSANINKANMELAKSIFGTSQFEYNKGVATMTDVLNSDYSYKQAQSDYITSLLNLVANRLAYERAKGTIIPFINNL